MQPYDFFGHNQNSEAGSRIQGCVTRPSPLVCEAGYETIFELQVIQGIVGN